MSECGPALPENIAHRERNNRVQVMEHRPHESKILRTTELHSDFFLATDTGNGMSKTQYKRVDLACQMWTQDGENAKQTGQVKHKGKSEQDNVFKVISPLSSIS